MNKDAFFIRVKTSKGYDKLMDLYSKVKKKMAEDGMEDLSRFSTLVYLCSFYLRNKK